MINSDVWKLIKLRILTDESHIAEWTHLLHLFALNSNTLKGRISFSSERMRDRWFSFQSNKPPDSSGGFSFFKPLIEVRLPVDTTQKERKVQ